LRGAGIEVDMYDMDVEMVICRLVMDVELQHIALDARVQFGRFVSKGRVQTSEPGRETLFQISHAPNITALDECEEV
jgi:hypothetical protein